MTWCDAAHAKRLLLHHKVVIFPPHKTAPCSCSSLVNSFFYLCISCLRSHHSNPAVELISICDVIDAPVIAAVMEMYLLTNPNPCCCGINLHAFLKLLTEL